MLSARGNLPSFHQEIIESSRLSERAAASLLAQLKSYSDNEEKARTDAAVANVKQTKYVYTSELQLKTLQKSAANNLAALNALRDLLSDVGDQHTQLAAQIAMVLAKQSVPDQTLTRNLDVAKVWSATGGLGSDITLRDDIAEVIDQTYKDFTTALTKILAEK